jgi:transposase
MYASDGRPSIAPEKLLRAQLLQMLYSIRSERLLMEEIDYSMLFRWFVGLNLDEEVWDPTVSRAGQRTPGVHATASLDLARCRSKRGRTERREQL